MKDYLPESMRRCPPGYARGELERAMEEGTILTARAVRCDETHDLIIDLGCAEGRIPRLEAAEGSVAFEHVRFAYQPERPLITDFNLTVKPGMTVAAVMSKGRFTSMPFVASRVYCSSSGMSGSFFDSSISR